MNPRSIIAIITKSQSIRLNLRQPSPPPPQSIIQTPPLYLLMQLSNEPSPLRSLPILFLALFLFSGVDIGDTLTARILHILRGGLHLG